MKDWIKKTLGITALRNEVSCLKQRVAKAEKIVAQHTVAHVDYHPRGQNSIIVVGQFRGKDYVDIQNIDNVELAHVVRLLKDFRDRGVKAGRIDAPPTVSAVIKHEVMW